ncbi:MAG TPA: methyl-accepting chemotaxis protein [Gemmatimonadaceae bacterium]|nr:methyl-accepting chemotaxis protein [Gemmatimonadaceae bacterium]
MSIESDSRDPQPRPVRRRRREPRRGRRTSEPVTLGEHFTGPSVAMAAFQRARASVASLRARIVLGVGLFALFSLGGLALLGGREISTFLAVQSDMRLQDAARRSGLLVESLLLEREREVSILATSPMLVDAARAGARRADELGLGEMSIDALERRFDAERSLEVSPRTRRYLRTLLLQLGIAEVMLTDASGLNSLTSGRTTDFVQRDEAWWEQAMREGITPAAADFDESVRQVVISIAAAVRERAQDPPAGVVKVSFGLAKIDSALRSASSIGGIQVDLVDGGGRVIASSGPISRLQVLPGADRLLDAPRDSIVGYEVPAADGGLARRRAAMQTVQNGRWRLIAHLDHEQTVAQQRQALAALLVVAGGLFVVVAGTLVILARSLTNRVSRPAAELAAAAEAVAAGDLTVEVAPSGSDDEIARLTRATRSMIADLRRLARAITGGAGQTSTLATEITIGSEHMAAAAQEMAAMSSDLSLQSTDMAQTIRQLAEDAGELVAISAGLDAGAEEGVARNSRLRALASDNRQRLDDSARALESLVADAQANVAASEGLTAASEEIRAFVSLVQKIARQSKLLALNAAMEAARAGEQGEGFSVVAGEVRRLSSAAAEGAERTETVVTELLARVAESRASSTRGASTVRDVLEATQQGHASFGHVEGAVAHSETWTASIAEAAHRGSERVQEMQGRIEQLAKGTEAFAAAMQQVAASCQEQSASTQQIAAAAERLTAAAEGLTRIVATFKLDGSSPSTTPKTADGSQRPATEATVGPNSAQPSIVSTLGAPALITES